MRVQRESRRRQREQHDTLEERWGAAGAAHLRLIAAMRGEGAQYRPRRLAATKRDLEDVRALGADDSEDDLGTVAKASGHAQLDTDLLETEAEPA